MEQGCTLTSAMSSRLLHGESLDLQMSKDDFTIVLLRSLGPANLSSAVVNDIFERIDEDKDGLIDAAELSNFLQSSEHGRFCNFMMKRLVHARNVGSSMFVCGSSLSILNYVLKRSYNLEGMILFVPKMIMWLFFIGSALFTLDFLRTAIKRLKDKGVELTRQLLRENFSSVEQIINLFWLFGSLAYVLATHSKHLTLSNAATSGLWVAGGFIYLFAGMLAFPSIYRVTSEKMNQQEELQKKMNGSIGFRRFDRRYAINCPEKTLDARTASVRIRRSFSESPMQPKHTKEPSLHRHDTCPVMIHIDRLDGDMKCRAESLKTLDTDSLKSHEDDYKLSWRTSDCSLENSTCSPSPSHDDVYALLSLSDAPINLDVFVQVLLQEQFANKVKYHNLNLWQEIAMSTSFYIAVLYTVAGLLFTIGAIIDAVFFTHDAVQNIFLSGSCIYFCGSSFVLFKQWQSARSSWDSLQSVISALKLNANFQK